MDELGQHRAKKRPEPLLLLGLPAFVGLRWTALELEMVEVAGVEPASESVQCPDLHA